ncbi:hypothetical protein F5I97DRAFT_1934445 [Phlebopus sp. FC_14]|nr:hypothetical protein F5I97DRAFT_1934445 [Phlebopus sp. FC_14]
MSLFSRLARPTPCVGRAYSSFFSSKPGGGRYFNPAKSPKQVVQTGRGKAENKSNVVASPTDPSASIPANGKVKTGPPEDRSSPTPSPSITPKPTDSSPHPSQAVSGTESSPFTSHTSFDPSQIPSHPSVSSKDYKLHQFFSLHRPLLLLSQPSSIIFDSVDPFTPLFPVSKHQDDGQSHAVPFGTIDDPPESSPEADADAARQLAHTLVMNRVASAMDWQNTLSRLGLSADGTEGDMALAKESAQKWVGIHADSTKRKRRKKMKKHKLKKRRRVSCNTGSALRVDTDTSLS